jgi:hypothetical protein
MDVKSSGAREPDRESAVSAGVFVGDGFSGDDLAERPTEI